MVRTIEASLCSRPPAAIGRNHIVDVGFAAFADAEVLLGVLSSERYNQDVEAVCNQIRQQLDERLAEIG